MHRHRLATTSIVIGLLLASTAVSATPSRAADAIVVTTTEDELNTDGDCSLREAVVAVNTEAPVDACPGAPGNNDILLEPVEYRLSIAGADEDGGATGDLDLLRPAQISPTGAGQPTIDAGGLDRIFDIHSPAQPGRTIFVGLILRNGDGGDEDGGAIRATTTDCDGSAGSFRGIELFGLVIDANRAGRGGGVHVGGCNGVLIIGSSLVRNVSATVGGGISVEGMSYLDIDTSTVSTNEAGSAGGGVWADLTHESLGMSLALATIADNDAPTGGGIWSSRHVTMVTTPIIARNGGGNCAGPGGPHSGAVSDDDSCGGPGLDDVGLLPLATVGGFPVHLLSPGSPAIEAAGVPPPDNWCSGNVRDDQVGTVRPLDGDGDGVAACDAGSIEAAAVAPRPSASPVDLPDTASAPPALDSGWPAIILGVAAAALGLASAAASRGTRAIRSEFE